MYSQGILSGQGSKNPTTNSIGGRRPPEEFGAESTFPLNKKHKTKKGV